MLFPLVTVEYRPAFQRTLIFHLSAFLIQMLNQLFVGDFGVALIAIFNRTTFERGLIEEFPQDTVQRRRGQRTLAKRTIFVTLGTPCRDTNFAK